MESPLNMKDFLNFKDNFKILKKEIIKKKVNDELTSEDLVQAF
jgi:hypothetical protein